MRMLGAEVIAVKSGSRTLKDAINEAFRDWVANVDRHPLPARLTVAGPHPFPAMVRDFHRVIGVEARRQILELAGRLPDAAVACVGGGSNAIGLFHAFIPDDGRTPDRLRGRRPRHRDRRARRHPRPASRGILHGLRSYVLQDDEGQIIEPHSISAGLDYPGIGPEHSYLKDSGRAEYRAVTDDAAMQALRCCRAPRASSRPSSARTRWPAPWRSAGSSGARTGCIVVVNLSGRGDKDMDTAARLSGSSTRTASAEVERGTQRPATAFDEGRAEGRGRLIAYLPAGFPDRRRRRSRRSRPSSTPARDVVEVGLPYSDPVLDGPVIQTADDIALRGGVRIADVMRTVRRRSRRTGKPVLVMTYWNPIDRYGVERFTAELAEAGGAGLILPDLPEEARRWRAAADKHGLDRVFVVAPSTNDERLASDHRGRPRLRLRRLADGRHRHPSAVGHGRGAAWSSAPAGHRRARGCRSASASASATAHRPPRSPASPTA